MTALTLADGVRSGRASAAASVEAALSALAAASPLNAATAVLAERARARAAALDRTVRDGADPGPLAGVPFAAKNLFDVAGLVTRAGSRATDHRLPAGEDAFAVAALERAGAVLVALANMDELAYGFSGENAQDGDTRNPRDPGRSAGGSSSGSAALVAAGAVPIALGTDTNGSVRVPAALCGVFGLKPTFGRLSRRGAFPFVSSLDHVGPFAATVGDLAASYDVLQGRDLLDPAQADRPVEPARDALADDGESPRVGVLGGYFAGPLADDAREAVRAAAAILGAEDGPELRRAAQGRAAAFVITTAEGGQLHRPGLATRPDAFGPLVRDRLIAGALVPAAWYGTAQKLRRLLAQELAGLFSRFDVLLAPATPCPAPVLGSDSLTVEEQTLPARLAIGLFTQALTLTGVPIGVAPRCGSGGLPVGVQVIAAPWREDRVLRALAALERGGFAADLEPRAP